MRTNRPTALSNNVEPFHLFKSSQDTESLEKASKQERCCYLLIMRLNALTLYRSYSSLFTMRVYLHFFCLLYVCVCVWLDTWRRCEKICQIKRHHRVMPSSIAHRLYRSAKLIIYSSHRHRRQPIRAAHLVTSTRIQWEKTPPERIHPARIRWAEM